ncbi:MAG: tyrosine-type recombinase/integrase [Aulosira sp. DedQUE10]|nr:tyrosine-type recombinase/integrase [Aulosira sp. DedQUE10]
MVAQEDKWICVDKRSRKLVIRFRVKGFEKQFYVATGLKNTKTNRDIVLARVEIIERDIALDRFDSTLESYKFGKYKKSETTASTKSLVELWDKFLDFKSQHLELSTLAADYKNITKIINELPNQSLNAASTIRDLLLKKYSYHTAHKSLAAFSRCCVWGIESGLLDFNPFEKIQLPKPKKRSDENTSEAYTLEQRDLILSAFDSHPKFSHYSSLIKFLFWTGCRPGEAFALTCGDINGDRTRISINKAYASRVRVLKGTKNNKRRVFPCGKGSRLNLLLLNLIPHSPDPRELLFKNKSGQRMSLKVLDTCWRGHNGGAYQYDGVVTDLATKGIVPYLKVYSTRHTFATWAIASGASPEKVAYWLGDDIRTVLEYYCHPDVTKAECPDF